MADILARWVFGKGRDVHRAERENGEAHFGSRFREPIYTEAYAEAAVVLFDHASKEGRLSELAQPILYLQRHTVELLLKETLRALHEIRTVRSDEHQIFGVGVETESVNADERRTVRRSHQLGDLLREVQRNLALLRFLDVPQSFLEAVAAIERVETREPSRLRYPFINVQKDTEEKSFVSATIAPVALVHREMMCAVQQCRIREDSKRAGDATFFEGFFDELLYAPQIRQGHLDSLLKKAGAGKLHWEPTPAKSWRHDARAFEPYSIAVDCEHILGICADGRTLLICPLDAAERLFALARIKEGDALSSVLVLEDHELYLVRQAAISAGLVEDDGGRLAHS